MKKLLIIFAFIIASNLIYGQEIWLNELHYDNAGGDTDEFIEIAFKDTSLWDINKVKARLYNGSNGKAYKVWNLSKDEAGEEVNNITLFSKYISSIQNGSPDGIAIIYDGKVIQFLSYEGTFKATDNEASGMTSIDIGVSQSSSTLTGSSLGLTGNGDKYNNFTWAVLSTATPGQSNTNQALPVELTTFTAQQTNSSIRLNWETATEVNNYGFEVERQFTVNSLQSQNVETFYGTSNSWKLLGFVEGHGNSNSPKFYKYVDNTISSTGIYNYRLKQIDTDGGFEYFTLEGSEFKVEENYQLAQNFPNPFNPVTTITYSIPKDGHVTLEIFNSIGEKITTLVNKKQIAGVYKQKFDASGLNSGLYIYKITSNEFTQARKMLLIK